jgi:hypothetical protein
MIILPFGEESEKKQNYGAAGRGVEYVSSSAI